MNAYYENGAVHNDQHKEMTIQVVGNLSPDAISKLVSGFMADKPCQAAEGDHDHATSQEPQTVDFCPSEEQAAAIPQELATEKAKGVLQRLQQIGVLDANFQPIRLSWAERGYLAQQVAYKLNIEHQWKTFAQLWHCDAATLRSGYNRAKDMPKMEDFDEKIKEIVS